MPRPYLTALLPALVFLQGCGVFHDVSTTSPTPAVIGSGVFVSESRPLQSVSRIVATGALRITVAHTGVPSLEIQAEDNLLAFIDSVERDGTLILGWKAGNGGINSHGVTVKVGVSGLRGVDVSGAVQVDVTGIAGDDFTVVVSGASQFTGAGSVNRLNLDVSGASRVSAAELRGRTETVRVSGASTAVLRVLESLTGTVSGASVLEFFGDPVVAASVSDTSIVRRLGP